jgi:hypothetical protein
MRKIYYVLIALSISCLAGCNLKKTTEEAKAYTLLTGRRAVPVSTVPLDSISLSDPYILADDATRMYYMTGSGGMMWKSADLKMWEGPLPCLEVDTTSWMGSNPMVWASELHKYKDKYYCFTTLTNLKIIVDTVPDRYNVQRRASHILMADKAEGPYRPMKENIYLPENWSTLDGTLWVEDETPYMVFCHEWMQIVDGTMDYIKLSRDLSESVGEPVKMFKASDAPWPREMNSIGELTFGMALGGYVTDGPFLFKTGTGRLGMLWSSWSSSRYAQSVSYSASGKLSGPWIHSKEVLNPDNMGHGMMFKTFDGKDVMALHYQSLDIKNPGPRKPMLLEVDFSGDELKILRKYNP